MPSGIFLGGPMDGQHLTHQTDRFECLKRAPPVRPSVAETVVDGPSTRHTVLLFEHVEIERRGFWVPTEHARNPVPYVLDRLVRGYRGLAE